MPGLRKSSRSQDLAREANTAEPLNSSVHNATTKPLLENLEQLELWEIWKDLLVRSSTIKTRKWKLFSAWKILKNQKASICVKNIQKQKFILLFYSLSLRWYQEISMFTSSFSTLQLAGNSNQEQILSLFVTFQTPALRKDHYLSTYVVDRKDEKQECTNSRTELGHMPD